MDESERGEQELFTSELTKAQQAWPGIQVNSDDFYRYVRDCLFRIQSQQSGYSSIGQLQVVDLYLAHSILTGSTDAINIFDGQYLSHIERHVPRRLRQLGYLDEIKQEVRIKLLLDTPEKPSKLANYYGQSPIGGWLATVVRRIALDHERKGSPVRQELTEQVLARATTGMADPERRLVKSELQELLRPRIQAWLASLSATDRVLLDRHFRADHSLARIACEKGVHRSTMMRHLRGLIEDLRRCLAPTQQGDPQGSNGDMISLLRSLLSQCEPGFSGERH